MWDRINNMTHTADNKKAQLWTTTTVLFLIDCWGLVNKAIILRSHYHDRRRTG